MSIFNGLFFYYQSDPQIVRQSRSEQRSQTAVMSRLMQIFLPAVVEVGYYSAFQLITMIHLMPFRSFHLRGKYFITYNLKILHSINDLASSRNILLYEITTKLIFIITQDICVYVNLVWIFFLVHRYDPYKQVVWYFMQYNSFQFRNMNFKACSEVRTTFVRTLQHIFS